MHTQKNRWKLKNFQIMQTNCTKTIARRGKKRARRGKKKARRGKKKARRGKKRARRGKKIVSETTSSLVQRIGYELLGDTHIYLSQ